MLGISGAENAMKNSWRSIGVAMLLAVGCTGSVFVTAARPQTTASPEAAANTAPPANTEPAKGDPAKADPAKADPAKADPQTEAPAKTAGSEKPASAPAASTPEETATINDDPTIAPDPRESADNDVTFPVDI
jgi:hypothetical protein